MGVELFNADGQYEANSSFKKTNMEIVRNVHFHMKIIRTFSKTLSLHSSLIMSDKVSHPYKTTDKIIVLVCTLHFWIANRKIKDSAPNDRKGLTSASWVTWYGQQNTHKLVKPRFFMFQPKPQCYSVYNKCLKWPPVALEWPGPSWCAYRDEWVSHQVGSIWRRVR